MKTKQLIRKLKIALKDVWGLIRSLWFLVFFNVQRFRIIYGYGSWWCAKRLADKRTRHWSHKWDQLGKIQGVLPIDKESLIVCSPLELKMLQKLGYISTQRNYTKYFKSNYYNTKKS